jgi:DNA mismatch repair ATPase MutS
MAAMLYDVKYKLHAKMEGLISFINHSKYILSSVSDKIIEPFFNLDFFKGEISITNSMTDIYRLWKGDNTLKNNIISMLNTIYAIDVIESICKLKNSRDIWSICNYDCDNTVMLDAKNPLLLNSNIVQVENPVNLNRNIIITGPNAGGKTTYIKTILTNVILSHTFGICYSIKSDIVLYDTIYSFMRLTDILGSKSYFEVEAEYCSKMIKDADELHKNNKKGLFLMDEPMHSTPPIEGMSTAYAVAEHLSRLEGIKLLITTHFHKLVILEELYPDKFINISVDAIKIDDGFFFPYKIKKGFSYQCIAIELLNSKHFPKKVIESAINMKNKICSEIIK